MQTIQTLHVSPKTYSRPPFSTELGERIVTEGVELMRDIGFEAFTFKKLAERIQSTEASVYRYFSNKHMFLVFLSNLYWNWLEQGIRSLDQKGKRPIDRLERAIEKIVDPMDDEGQHSFPFAGLTELITVEGPKVYLTRHVDEENKEGVFLAYKHLCETVAQLVADVNPTYPYAHSLASTIIETAHDQLFFSRHLPRLTDIESSNRTQLTEYLTHTVASAIL